MKPGDPLEPSHPVMEAPQERVLVARARVGDETAFGALVAAHQHRVYGLARRIVGKDEDAEEVAQDAFVRAWRALPEFRGESAFGTWLFRITSRLALDRRSRLVSREQHEETVEAPPEVPADAATGADDPGGQLDRLLDRLTPQARAAVVLYYYEDRSVADVAVALGAPEGTVKTLLSRARTTLREAMEREARIGR